MTTLLALYRRPDGGPEAQATFERRYTEEHLPLVAGTPGLRETRAGRVTEALGGETDLILVTFDALRRPGGARRRSRLRRDAGRRPEPARDRARAGDVPRARGRRRRWTPPLPRPWILSEHSRGRRDQDRPVVDLHQPRATGPERGREQRDDVPASSASSSRPRRPRPRHRRAICPASRSSRSQRPEALNALSFDLLDELATALEALDADPACRAIVITGSGDRAFAAGADIRELEPQTSATLTAGGGFDAWDRIAAIGLPLIAAVRGFALGGGCELAMACDMIVAAEDASFGQPEIRLGVMPGRRRHPAPHAGDRQGPGDGADPDRPDDDRAGSRRARAGHPGRAGRGDRRRGPRARGQDRRHAAAGRPGRQGRHPRRRGAQPRPMAWPGNGRHSSGSSTPTTRPRGWRPSPRNARPSGRDADRERAREGGRMDRESQGGSDVGRDYERDLGDEAPAAIRDTAPDYLAPIDASAPVSGHSPAPVHDDVARRRPRTGLDASPATCSIPRSARSGRWASRSTSIDRETARGPLGAESRPAAPRCRAGRPAGRLHDRRRRVRHRRQRRPPAVVGRRAVRDPGRRAAQPRGVVGDGAVDRRGLRRAAADQLGHGARLGCRPDPASRGRRAPDVASSARSAGS